MPSLYPVSGGTVLEFLRKLFGIKSHNEKELERISRIVEEIDALSPEIGKLEDSAFSGETASLRRAIFDRIDEHDLELKKIADELRNPRDDDRRQELLTLRLETERELISELKDVTMELLPRAFALIREAADRRIGCMSVLALPREEISALGASIEKWADHYAAELSRCGNPWNVHMPMDFYRDVRALGDSRFSYRPFGVQLIGGIVLHEGKIAEMKTGEGKTLAATMPVFLNGLIGKGVHVVTVNSYLARRDAEWMGAIYRFMGLTVDCVDKYEAGSPERREAYLCDITYGTNNEFGFDYLRDNMAIFKEECVQRPHFYAIIDEVDSILIDEARTPLIISGAPEKSSALYQRFAMIAKSPSLKPEVHYVIDEKAHSVTLTEDGVTQVERMLGIDNLYGGANMELTHYLNAAMKALHLFRKDVDYVVKDGKVIIVDEFTGRLMPDRRYSQGLHQSLEAKEGLKVEQETQTLATITLQNYFRMYRKLGGMTGTAKTEEKEFRHIYGLGVVEVPTNRPMVRQDLADVIYKTKEEKYEAVADMIEQVHAVGQPILVGTISIEASETIGALLKARGLACNILNAKYHEKEAEIVADAGKRGQITIATNMAGRGTDIKLDNGAREAGGLFIMGTERHESRRIDNQLRGRSGRQGDPGASRFFISLEDDLMRLFGSDRIKTIMETLGLQRGEAIEHKYISKAIEHAQKKVEERNFAIRKQVLEYDDVMNQQRIAIYEQRQRVLDRENLRNSIIGMTQDIIDETIETCFPEEKDIADWDFDAMVTRMNYFFPIRLTREQIDIFEDREDIRNIVSEMMEKAYSEREETLGADPMRELEQIVVLRVVDSRWMEHLANMDVLQEGIWTRAYGQKDPLMEYKFEALKCYQALIRQIMEEVVDYIFKIQFNAAAEEEKRLIEERPEYHTNKSEQDEEAKQPMKRKDPKVGVNSPCPCGSGKKFKKCCGRDE
ncbi:MAG: preprotein translocase subunit SecA [Candidatus Wallbacteria bacterium HGW-Wallbacteria-1]|uniref:Protein translocase subunit SecA n=1 Tax=Candidatus Wallbacteria bacterium HGW-Wallbacteria-1 TaxID=2013854 RepID=A0A2N1PV03_9BACT|nr:MAG: preprotein translocase subunit SecA [Candidatus Wallbacteria bacterium HGW-Wallbacteria-1]